VYLIPYNEDRLFIGATSELMQDPEERNKRIELTYLLDKAKQVLCPDINSAEVEKVLLGYRPTTADAFPLMGETSIEGVWVASGTKRDGFHMAPVIAKELSQAILEKAQPFEGKFNPERTILSYMERDKMLNKAAIYFESDLDSVQARWQKMVNRYPFLKNASVEPELWQLYENDWVHRA
jgi:glycerol-3-phosphate dehydrogenase